MSSKAETLTGISSLDSLIGDVADDALLFIAGRPAMGKTALAIQIANHRMKNNKKRTMIFSFEEGERWLTRRLEKINNGPLPENHNIIINDSCWLSVSDMQSICEKVDDLGIVIIDYLQLIAAAQNETKKESRIEEIDDICQALKAMAKKLHVPVVCTSQVHRACEYRVDKRPILSDLRYYPTIESLSDQVLFLYRDGYYNPETSDLEHTECIIAKNAYGSLGTVELRWDAKIAAFVE